MLKALTFASFVAAVVASGGAGAQQLENPRTDYIAYTRPKGRMALGLFKVEQGLIYLLYQSPIETKGTAKSGNVTVEGDLTAESTEQRHLSLVPGVSFVWKRWELDAGVGYGVFYLPSLGLASTERWPLLDLGFAYRFDVY